MRKSISVSFAIASILVSSGSAWAQTAVSGKPLRLMFYSDSTNPDCTVAGQSTVRVTQPPQHGTVRITRTREFAVFRAGSLQSACNTRRVSGTLAQYVSHRGYFGPDSVSLEYISYGGTSGQRTYSINVR
jgi:hypothetical protein